MVSPFPRLPLAHRQPDLLQVAHRIGDRSRTDLEHLRELRRGAPAVVGDEERDEHPGRHPRNPSLGEREGTPLDEPHHRLLVTPSTRRLHIHYRTLGSLHRLLPKLPRPIYEVS